MADDDGVRVTMRPASSSDDAAEEWDIESQGGATSAIDPGALSALRAQASASAESRGADFAAAAAEFGNDAPTVAENIDELSPNDLLQAVALGNIGEDAATEFDGDSVTRMDPRQMPAAATEDSLGKQPCPKCGVMVSPGYPNCPRCKSPLVDSKARERRPAGGTSLGGRTIPWTIVFIAAVLTAVIYYLAEREVKSSGGGGTATSQDVGDGETAPAAKTEGAGNEGQPTSEEPSLGDEDTATERGSEVPDGEGATEAADAE